MRRVRPAARLPVHRPIRLCFPLPASRGQRAARHPGRRRRGGAIAQRWRATYLRRAEAAVSSATETARAETARDAALEALEGARREAKGADGGEAASSLRHTLEGMEHALAQEGVEHALAAEGAVKTELRVWGPEDAKSLFLRVQDRVFVRGPMHVQRLRAELQGEVQRREGPGEGEGERHARLTAAMALLYTALDPLAGAGPP